MTRSQAGFTIVELLVALSLFALLSVASLALLRSSIDTQTALAGRLDRVSALERTRAVLADGLLTAQPQAGVSGTPAGAFVGTRQSLSFVSSAPGPHGDPMFTRLSFSASGDRLVLMRGDDTAPAILIDDLAAARFRYRGADGSWQSMWTPLRPGVLPRAAELTVQQRGGAEVLMRFVIAPDWPMADPIGGPA